MTIDVEQVFRTMMADPSFEGFPEAARAAFRELIDPPVQEVLDLLDAPVSVAVLARIRLATARRALAQGFAYKLVEALPPEARVIGSQAVTPEKLDESLRQSSRVYAEMMLMTPIWLSRRGLKERDALAHPTVGRFRAETMAAYDAGALTVRKLLELQPAVITENNV